MFIALPNSIELHGTTIEGATDRQELVAGFDQAYYSSRKATVVGVGGLASPILHVAARKGIGGMNLLDRDSVEASNLSRQRFFPSDIGQNKALAMAKNLIAECTYATTIRAYPLRLQQAIDRGISLLADVALILVDNNPTRVEGSQYFRKLGMTAIFAAVSRDADSGYVFVQDPTGPCIGCLFPDIANDGSYPCPGTPAIADILQAIAGFVVYAVDTVLMSRPRSWNYRRFSLSDGSFDCARMVKVRSNCPLYQNHT